MPRNVYLNMKTLAEARRLVRTRLGPLGRLESETLPVPEAVGRVLAEPVYAALSSPAYHAAAMDGIAVRAEATFGASEGRPLRLALGREAFWVNTGNPLPPGTDAVIMVEQVRVENDGEAVIEAPAFPWQHVRKVGEDIVATELLFPRHHRLTPYCVGALLAGGVFRVPVWKRPQARIVPTGSELLDWQTTPLTELGPGRILETNSFLLAALLAQAGGAARRRPPVPDDRGRIRREIEAAAAEGDDLVMILGGSSAGSEDHARAVIADCGEVLVHGVAMMPGKPVVVGLVGRTPVFGIPGYPVSAILVFEELVVPLLCAWLGQPEPVRETVTALPTRKIPSRLGIEEFVRLKLGEVGGRVVATPLARAAGSITSITEADGILRIPPDTEGVAENTPVRVELLRPRAELARTLVVVGSHDNTLDVLADLLKASPDRIHLSSSHVGSLGGLMAVKRGVCHLAGCHLLDPADGSYNVSYIRRYLPDRTVHLVHLVERENGLIVARGNPRGIRGIEDLTRPDVSFVNRQAGSGTRILLDWRLEQLGIDPAAIRGYGNEEFTHMAVAVAVASGAADAGLGIYAAARALGLDFIPVVTESYELVIPAEQRETLPVQALLSVIASDEFRRRVEALGGYHTARTGQERTIGAGGPAAGN
ncbi:MAG: molybdopterin biosynthesis protein [Desulfobacterales bacterium]